MQLATYSVWENTLDSDAFYPPGTGWNPFPGKTYNNITVVFPAQSEDSGPTTAEFQYMGLFEWPDSSLDGPVWENITPSPYDQNGSISSFKIDGDHGWRIKYNHLGGAVFSEDWQTYNYLDPDPSDKSYPPQSGAQWYKPNAPTHEQFPDEQPALIFNDEPLLTAKPAPTTVSNTGAYSEGAGDSAHIETSVVSGSLVLSGRRLVATRIRNVDIRDGLLYYDLYEIVRTAPFNTDDEWFHVGRSVMTEFDEQKFKSYTRTQVNHTGDPATAEFHVNLISAPRMRKVTRDVSRKLFIRQPTDQVLINAGIPTSLSGMAGDYDQSEDVSYTDGSTGRLHYVERTIITRDAWASNAISALDLSATPPVYKQYKTSPGPY